MQKTENNLDDIIVFINETRDTGSRTYIELN